MNIHDIEVCVWFSPFLFVFIIPVFFMPLKPSKIKMASHNPLCWH